MNREELLAKYAEPISVLDHGHVRLVDCMGGDERIDNAARLSYQKGTRKVNETRGLLRRLMRNKHWSPFEQCVITLDVKMPIFIARQFVRHRTKSLNELSGRYSEMPEEFYVPTFGDVCYQDKKNRQGRAEAMPVEEATHFINGNFHGIPTEVFKAYKAMLAAGMSRETARMILPLSTYTQWWETSNLRNLFGFLTLRLDPHAQWEARCYADVIAKIVADWVPLSWEAFIDFDVEAVGFSRLEKKALADLIHWDSMIENPEIGSYVEHAMARAGLTGTEAAEFIAKLKKLTEPST